MRSVFAWAFVALIMAVFIEWGFRIDAHEWDVQMKRNAQWRALAGGK